MARGIKSIPGHTIITGSIPVPTYPPGSPALREALKGTLGEGHPAGAKAPFQKESRRPVRGVSHKLGKQFEGYTGGPEEAKRRYELHTYGVTEEEGRQIREEQRLPAPPGHGQQELRYGGHPYGLSVKATVPLAEAHTQTPEQFTRDPRTWWHGRVTRGGVRGRLGGSTVGRGEGFHAGVQAAARIRVTGNIRRRGLKGGMAGHLYPLRITGPVDQPEEARPDVSKHRALGPRISYYGSSEGGRTRGYLYKNLVEAPGQMSVGVPRRKGFLSTQREMVSQAKKEGKFVHPNIQWAVGKTPEHTTEEITGRVARGDLGPRPQAQPRLFLGEQPSETTERRSYQTERGTQHVWRHTGLGESTLQPKQWASGTFEEHRQSVAQKLLKSPKRKPGQTTQEWLHDIMSP